MYPVLSKPLTWSVEIVEYQLFWFTEGSGFEFMAIKYNPHMINTFGPGMACTPCMSGL